MKKTSRRRKVISGEEHHEVVQKEGEEVVSEEVTSAPVDPPDDQHGAEVEAQFSRVINTGNYTTVRIGSVVRVPCAANPHAIDKRMSWAEDFVQARVNQSSEIYE